MPPLTYPSTLLDFAIYPLNLVSLISLNTVLFHLSIASLNVLLISFLLVFIRIIIFFFLCPNNLILYAFTKLVTFETSVNSRLSLILLLRKHSSSLSYTGRQMVPGVLFSNDISFCFIQFVSDQTSHPYVRIGLNISV